jgi:predicted nucleotidyltransferase
LAELSKYKSINEIRMFGSQVKQSNLKSDIDIMILYDNNDEYELIIKDLVKISHENDIIIHPVVYEKNIDDLKENYFINENIIKKSKIIFQRTPHCT